MQRKHDKLITVATTGTDITSNMCGVSEWKRARPHLTAQSIASTNRGWIGELREKTKRKSTQLVNSYCIQFQYTRTLREIANHIQSRANIACAQCALCISSRCRTSSAISDRHRLHLRLSHLCEHAFGARACRVAFRIHKHTDII